MASGDCSCGLVSAMHACFPDMKSLHLVEHGTFPFYRTEDVEEERRLLYVACTRAQSLLYLSHASKRKVAAETKSKELSEFVGVVIKADPVSRLAPMSVLCHLHVVLDIVWRDTPAVST